jgi:putative oxidoreductase
MLGLLYPWMHLVGRICLGFIFFASGINHFTGVNAMTGYAQAKGVPFPRVMVLLSGAMIFVGSVLVVLGWHRFIGAGLLFIFLILAAVMMHAFWKENDPVTRAGERAHFLKNLALAGAALLVAYYAGFPWPMSLGG